ncbi:MAG: homoserine dehydrogenase [Oscillospiraceae bacterium]|nr:homoserine dehydrogenase [Oscillospiraceae bacterium]
MKIAVMGHGVVGSGVVEVFYQHYESLTRKSGKEMDIKYILDLRDFPDSPYRDKFIKDFSLIENDPEIGIVVEVMGGLHPAYDYVKACLEKGKSVVTSNKELVAAKGAELLHLAREHNVNFFFEASVGGGIPIIRPLHLCLAANEISEIAGILNGTTNFILTKMIREQMSFADALKLAQELGYAERNPAADVEGQDACRKICILVSLAFGRHVYPEEVHTEGITRITLEDVAYAGSWGGVIKLIGRAKRLEGGKVSAMVSPAFIHAGSQLASVDDVFNGILVRGDATGDVVFYGKGAGKLPTASAVVADVVEAAKATGSSRSLNWEDGDGHTVCDWQETVSVFYIRLKSAACQKELVKQLFGEVKPLHRDGQPQDEAAFVTGEILEKDAAAGLEQLKAAGAEVLGCIRVLDY